MANKDMIGFAVGSLITQVFISYMLVVASTASQINAQELTDSQIGMLQDKANVSDIINNETAGNMATKDPGMWYFLEQIFMVGHWLGQTALVLGRIGLTYITLGLSFVAWGAATGGMAGNVIAVLGLVVFIWQLATMRYILRFMFPGRFG